MFPHIVVLVFASAFTQVGAQILSNSTDESALTTPSLREGESYELPPTAKANGELPSAKPSFALQDALTLEVKGRTALSVEAVADLDLLRHPSAYRKTMISTSGGQPYLATSDGLQTGLAMISAAYRATGKTETTAECPSISRSIEQSIKLEESRVLELVEREVSANPGCACEIVKTALKTTEAGIPLATSIVETAITASPENMRLISQCAIAAVPESITAVQALLAKLDPNSGNEGSRSKSAKSSKDGKSAKSSKGGVASAVSPPDPLDRPFIPNVPPPFNFPPPTTDVDPSFPKK